jgi:hypothetical protein
VATVTQIADRASQLTGLAATGTERVLTLAAMNNANLRAVMDTEVKLTSGSYVFTTDTTIHTLATMLPNNTPLKLKDITLLSGGYYHNLEKVSYDEVRGNLLTSDDDGITQMYAMMGVGSVHFWPAPSIGDTAYITYVDTPKELVESGATSAQETTPTTIPAQWHWDVLLPGTVLQLLDKDQRGKDVEFWLARYGEGIGRMKEWVNTFGGSPPRIYVEDFDNTTNRYSNDTRFRT